MIYYVLIALLVVACGPGLVTTSPGLFFSGFEPDMEKMLRRAADELFSNVKLDRRVDVVAVREGAAIGAHACVDCANCSIKVNLDLPDLQSYSYVKAMFWHEFGHCVGLSHSTGVMDERLWPAERWYYTDAQKFFDDVTEQQKRGA